MDSACSVWILNNIVNLFFQLRLRIHVRNYNNSRPEVTYLPPYTGITSYCEHTQRGFQSSGNFKDAISLIFILISSSIVYRLIG